MHADTDPRESSNSGADPSGSAPPSAHVTWRREDVQVASNVRLAVFRTGCTNPDAPVIVCVHGLGHWSQAAWTAVAQDLQRDYAIVAFDLPGFGESGKPDVRYDLGFFCDTLAALIERLGLRRFTLAGHSLGGLIAASYAARRPDRVALLVLIDPAGFRRTARFLLHVVGSTPASWFFRIRPSRRFVRRTLMQAVVDPAIVPEAVHERAFRLAQDPAYLRAFARVYCSAMRDWLDLRSLHARLATYRGAVVLAWGRHDRYVPIAALENARRVYPQAQVAVLERSAHLPNVEEPAAISALIRRSLPSACSPVQSAVE